MPVEGGRRRALERNPEELARRVGRLGELGEEAARPADALRETPRVGGRAAHVLGDRPRELHEGARQRRRLFRVLGRRNGGRVGARVEEDAQELHAAHPVDHAVMHLAEDRGPVAVVPVDLVQLPERELAVERLREEPAHEGHELRVVARRLQLMAHHVPADVEAGVGLPGGMREVQRHRHHALGVARDEMEARGDVGAQPLEVEPAVDRVDARDVQQLTGLLQVVEGRVERSHAFRACDHGCLRCPRGRR